MEADEHVVEAVLTLSRPDMPPLPITTDTAVQQAAPLASGGAPVMVLNGPNLQRLGTREPDVYGVVSLPEIHAALEDAVPDGVRVELLQTDDEATLIGWLHVAADTRSPVILNPAAFSHYSYALHDAVRIVTGRACRSSRCTSRTRRRASRSAASRSCRRRRRASSRGSARTGISWR